MIGSTNRESHWDRDVAAVVLALVFLVGGIALAAPEPDTQCASYGSACNVYNCEIVGTGTNQCTQGGQTFNWSHLSQTGPAILGTCQPGTGTCEDTDHYCTAKKYDTVLVGKPTCDDTTLKCIDSGTVHGCQ